MGRSASGWLLPLDFGVVPCSKCHSRDFIGQYRKRPVYHLNRSLGGRRLVRLPGMAASNVCERVLSTQSSRRAFGKAVVQRGVNGARRRPWVNKLACTASPVERRVRGGWPKPVFEGDLCAKRGIFISFVIAFICLFNSRMPPLSKMLIYLSIFQVVVALIHEACGA